MNVSVEKLENSMARLTITVDAADFDKAVDSVYRRQRGQVQIPGFRKGKAPRKVIERFYGSNVFFNDAINDLVNSTYPQAAEESGEEITSNPEIRTTQVEAGKDFIYTAEVALKPAVTLGQYKGVEVTKQDVSVSDKEVEDRLEAERQKNATYEEVTRPAQNGDQVTLDFEGFVDGVPFDGGKGTDHPLVLGSGSFIPGFEEQLVGVSAGEDKDVVVTFPEEYGAKDLAGKEATFKCSVKKVREKQLPELDDEFADEVSDFETLEEYKEDLKATIGKEKTEAARTAKENEAIATIVDEMTIEIPQAMLETQEENVLDEYARQFQQQGLSMEQYYQMTGTTKEQLLEQLAPEAEKRIKTRLALEEVVRLENIVPTEEDYEKELQNLAEAYKMDVEKVRDLFKDRDKKGLMEDIAVQKAVTLIVDSVVEVEPKEEKSEDAAESAEEQQD